MDPGRCVGEISAILGAGTGRASLAPAPPARAGRAARGAVVDALAPARFACTVHRRALVTLQVKRFKDVHPDLPRVLKGIATAEDADIACRHGVEVVYVSNHGGRQLERGRGSVAVLPEVVKAVGDRARTWIDGDFVRGSDVVKGIALGAEVVGLGRIACIGLAAAGEAGLVCVLELLEEEVRGCLGLLGVTRFDELAASYLRAETPVTSPSVVSAFPLLDLDTDRY